VLLAVLGLAVAALVAFMPYARRPRLTIEEDTDRIQSRVELSGMGGLPHVRLLVVNAKGRRAAHGSRVLVEGYRRQNDPYAVLTTLGHPSLGWPSAPEANETAAVTVFAGGTRPITLGFFIRARVDPAGVMLRPAAVDAFGNAVRALPHYARAEDFAVDDPTVSWYLKLALAFDLDINDDRDKLPPVEGGYVVRLLVGADDGAARVFEVDMDWNGEGALRPQEVLDSALDHLSVRSVKD
jgi:hypothetical protein